MTTSTRKFQIHKVLGLGLLSLALFACSAKERESKLPSAEQGKVFAIEELKDIANEKSAALHVQVAADEAMKKELAAREKVDTVVLSDRLKTLATNSADKALASSLEKSNFAFSIIDDSELHVFKVEAEGEMKNLDRDKSFSIRHLRLLRAIHKNKDQKRHEELTREVQNIRFAEGAADAAQQKQYRLTRVTRYAIKTMGILTNKRTDFGEKKSVLTVQESSPETATHILLGDVIADQPAEGAAAGGAEAKAATR